LAARWCGWRSSSRRREPADLDRLFQLRWQRRIGVGGSIRFRHWSLYPERGLAVERTAVWVHGETVTVAYAADTFAQYPITRDADGRGLKEVGEPRLFDMAACAGAG
jgi:hypothetical protein